NRLSSVARRKLAEEGPPVIETVGKNVRNGLFFYNGDTLQVTGSGFGGLSGVYLAAGDCNQYGCRINPHAGAPVAVTPLHVSSGSFAFVPQVHAPYKNQLYPHFLIVTKGSAADTSDTKLDIGAAPPVKKITGVKQTAVRSGLRIDVTGVGFDEVDGAYFGNGTLNSQNNLLYSIANRSSTSIQVMTTANCDQRGILMLRETPTGQGTPALITGDTPIEVACVPSTPAGYVVNSPSMPGGNTYVMPGEKILILGTNLRYVTGVVDQRNQSHPFTFAPGSQSVPDRIQVTVPSVHPDRSLASYGFRLENSLTDPVVPGSVSGTAMVMAPPQWTSISRGWAEPGQSVQVTGSDLAFGSKPEVTVGGVAAEVTQFTQNYVTFRLGAATTSGPIRIKHQAGAVDLTGPFTGGYPPKSHPGFFVVSGPSSVTEIVRPRPALATGDTLLVRGQNLARLSGICLLLAGQGTAPAGYVPFMRTSGSGQEFEVTNTEMRVVFGHSPASVAPGAVQLYERPSGSSQTVCTTNAAGIQWP
ncbi:MAG TPA: IPT/TIG domain-containing protein, partial [Gemmatimonadales bacterium]